MQLSIQNYYEISHTMTAFKKDACSKMQWTTFFTRIQRLAVDLFDIASLNVPQFNSECATTTI